MATISVLVPVRNEGRCIEQTLRALLEQEYPAEQFEVLVADGLSTDDTVPIVRRLQGEYDNLKLFFNPRRLSSAARNTAVRHMTGDYAVVVDGHCHIEDRKYLQKLVAAFESSGADCLGRPQPLNTVAPSPFQQAVSLARQSRLGHNPDSDIFSDQARFVEPQNTAVAYRREVFQKIGLFDQGFDACEDVEFNQRVFEAGFTCYFTPELRVAYMPRNNWRALFYQLGRYGSGRARLAAKNPASLTIPALVPPLWMAWLLAGPIAAAVFLPFLWLYLGTMLLYLGVISGAAVVLGSKAPLAVRFRIPLVFVAIHMGFAWGFWKEVARQVRARLRPAPRLLPGRV